MNNLIATVDDTDIQIKDCCANGFEGNGNGAYDSNFELTPEELQMLLKDFI